MAAVFAEGIATGLATFETDVPGWAEWDAAHLAEHRFVAELDGEVVGWVARRPVLAPRGLPRASARRASTSPSGRAGAASAARCSSSVIERAGDGGSLDAPGRDLPGERREPRAARVLSVSASVGVRERIGQLDGVWRDVVLLELRL